jgi:TetR/AcrR family transcriptional repressor of nem operon
LSPAIEASVVAAAAEVFWRSGYDDAKIEDVVQASGANRYALYGAFRGKRDLFLAVLDAHHAKAKAIFLDGLNDEGLPPIDAIRRVCAWAISEMAARGGGCLIHNVAAERARDDGLIAARIDQYTAEILGAFELALSRAQERGELSPAATPAEGARHLLIMKLGLGDLARGGASEAEMLAALDAGLALLAGRRCSRLEARPGALESRVTGHSPLPQAGEMNPHGRAVGALRRAARPRKARA